MTPQDPISTPLVERTNRALESFDPFQTPIQPPKRLDGKPVQPVVGLVIPSNSQELDSTKQATKASLIPEIDDSEAKSDVPQRSIDDEYQESVEPIEPKKRGRKPKALAETSAPVFENPIHESRSTEGLPSYRCEFAGRDIFVGWPWYKFSNPVTAACQVAMALDFGRDKIRFDMAIGDSKIEHARNRLAHKFLETDAKWLMMIDDDIIPCIGRPAWFRYWVQAARSLADLPLQRHVLHRMVGAGKTLVGASYFGRQEGGALMAADQTLAPRARGYEDKVVEVDWVGTGCILIHRKVFEDIRAKFGDALKIDVPDYDYDYFRPFDSAHGEDVSFCKRAKDAGHQPHLDLGLPVFHVGYKLY
jgi:hypothetical protein